MTAETQIRLIHEKEQEIQELQDQLEYLEDELETIWQTDITAEGE